MPALLFTEREMIERTKLTHRQKLRIALMNPYRVKAERCRRSFYHFMQEFWDCVSSDPPHWNWHIEYMCQVLQETAERVADRKPKLHDVIFNVPPGSTKSITCTVMFPVWCWTRWPWMSFIAASYGGKLALEQAEKSRELIRSEKFRKVFPDLVIKDDKDTKSNFRIVYREDGKWKVGGNRFSTSVGGSLTGFHGHILIVDDPINPHVAFSIKKLKTANEWMDQTLSTRKTDKDVSPVIIVMQRLHQNDPTGHRLKQAKDSKSVFHVSLPGEIDNYAKNVKPAELVLKYKDGLLDPVRLTRKALNEAEEILGQYGYAGQIGQNPTPPAGGMFKVDRFVIMDSIMPSNILMTWRYWDKAATKQDLNTTSGGARTAGVKMSLLKSGKFYIHDCKAGRWDTDEREDIIRDTADGDGRRVRIALEQEPGSGGKDSGRASIRNLAGYHARLDRPTGDKVFRADPYSVQVNHGNVILEKGSWNDSFIEEHRFFPLGTTKDMVDAASGAFKMLTGKRKARMLTRSKQEQVDDIIRKNKRRHEERIAA